VAKRRVDSRRGARRISEDLTDGERLNLILAELAMHNSTEA